MNQSVDGARRCHSRTGALTASYAPSCKFSTRRLKYWLA